MAFVFVFIMGRGREGYYSIISIIHGRLVLRWHAFHLTMVRELGAKVHGLRVVIVGFVGVGPCHGGGCLVWVGGLSHICNTLTT